MQDTRISRALLRNHAGLVGVADLALRWILDQPAVSTIIAGVTKPTQLDDNVAATKRDPLELGLVEELRDWYERKVRPHVRGHI